MENLMSVERTVTRSAQNNRSEKRHLRSNRGRQRKYTLRKFKISSKTFIERTVLPSTSVLRWSTGGSAGILPREIHLEDDPSVSVKVEAKISTETLERLFYEIEADTLLR